MSLTTPCACGSGRAYDACCGPLHAGAAAETPEQLMRSRYAAYAVGGRVGEAYIFRTWHPRTRPDDVTVDPHLEWTGLEILDVVDGGAGADAGEVEFAAHYRYAGRAQTLHERSRFGRRGGRWVYVEAITTD